jgi:translation initiation factor IF-3
VKLIDENGQTIGVVQTSEAINIAREKDLDLVLVGKGENPVCKIMDYGKYKFDQQKRDREAKKKTKGIEQKEIRVTPNIDEHDFTFKSKNARGFIEDGHKVKITVRFRGREMAHTILGRDVLNKFIDELKDVATVERPPLMEGRNMFIILSKNKEVK